MVDPLKPDIQLLSKLGSIAVHLDEYSSKNGVAEDIQAAISIFNDRQVQEWIEGMNKLTLLPIKR